MFHWLKKCRQVDPSEIVTYPWQSSALTATRWSDWGILRIGLQGYPEACMVLNEAAWYALFMVWQKAGLREAIAAKCVSGRTPRARAGSHGHGNGPQFFFNDVRGISEKIYDVHNDGAYGASCRSLLPAGATILRRQSAHREGRWRLSTLQCTANNTVSPACDGANVHPR